MTGIVCKMQGIGNLEMKCVVTKKGNNHKPSQTSTNDHKLSANDHKPPANKHKPQETTSKRSETTSKQPQTTKQKFSDIQLFNFFVNWKWRGAWQM